MATDPTKAAQETKASAAAAKTLMATLQKAMKASETAQKVGKQAQAELSGEADD